MTQITCRDLTIGYGSRIILKHLNFTVNEGDYLCIIGENGSGKSSLMRTILNLQNPINGQILYDHQQQLKITHLAHRCYRELSGGQQQRVLLARALCATKKILFLDEPVSGLDPEVTADFYALIRHLNRREGITILMISHDLQATAADATHILHLGTPFFYGLASDYFHSEVHTHDRLI